MTRKVTLIVLTFIGFYYCFRLGYIWSAYVHGGQLVGVPFAIILLLTTAVFFDRKTPSGKTKTFIFGVVYFLTLAAFSITIEIIRATMEDYFEFLYYEPGGYVNKIFLGWVIIGTIVLLLAFRQVQKRKSYRALKS